MLVTLCFSLIYLWIRIHIPDVYLCICRSLQKLVVQAVKSNRSSPRTVNGKFPPSFRPNAQAPRNLVPPLPSAPVDDPPTTICPGPGARWEEGPRPRLTGQLGHVGAVSHPLRHSRQQAGRQGKQPVSIPILKTQW